MIACASCHSSADPKRDGNGLIAILTALNSFKIEINIFVISEINWKLEFDLYAHFIKK